MKPDTHRPSIQPIPQPKPFTGRWLSRLASPRALARERAALALMSESNETAATLLLDMLERVQASNREVRPARWLDRLEACGAALRSVDPTLRRDYISSPLPLPLPALQAAIAHRRCYELLGDAFSALAHHLARTVKPGSLHQSQILESAIVGGLQCGKNALLISQLMYSPPPPRLWQNLHRLYALTEDATAPPASEGMRAQASAQAVYLHTLLLGVASPEALPRTQLLLLDRLLPTWTRHALLHPPGPPPAPGWYAVVPRTDGAPTGVRFAAHDATDVWLYLDLSRLAQRLRQVPEESVDQSMATLRQHLARVWAPGRDRQSARRQQPLRLQACVGVTAIHGLLRRTSARARPATPEKPAPDATCPVMILDHSDDGGCLLWRADPQHCKFLRVGALIGVFTSEPSQARLHALGSVCWMKSVPDGAVMAGVTWLGAEAVPVGIEFGTNDGRAEATIQPGLLLTGGAGGWREPQLVTPQSMPAGGMIDLRNGGQRWPTRVGGLNTGGVGYCVYTVQLQPTAGPSAPPPPPGYWRAGA